ncbi:MAG: hypothetical protein MUC63_01480 [Planctomycetes bacterium]|jgi:hypothetical protein|nr:hypothetical protein [Planctomycetota bacterium]
MIGRIWETHKMFIVGIAVGILFVLVSYQVAVAPLGREAKRLEKKSADNLRTLKNLFSADAAEHPTPTNQQAVIAVSSSLKSDLDQVKKMVAFPVQSPFVLPAGESMPEAYLADVRSKTKREIETAANAKAIGISEKVRSAGEGSVDAKQVPDALVQLAVMRRALLTAVDAGVSSLEDVVFAAGERSAPVAGQRLSAKLLSVTVKGSPASLQEWLRNLGRRESFLLISTVSVRGPDPNAEDAEPVAKVVLGPLEVEEAAPETGKEEEE